MKILVKFFARIIGLRHIKFKKSGIFLFEFPMFLVPLKFHKDLIEKISFSLGIDRTKDLFYQISLSQAKFAVEYFKKKFNIHPNSKDLSFYLEQVNSMGLGRVEFKSISDNKENLVLNFFPLNRFKDSNLYDFYLEGIILGGCQGVFNCNFIIQNVKVIDNYLEYNLVKSDEIYGKLISNYNHNSISFIDRINIENSLFKKLKSDKNLFYLNNCGILFNSQNYFFALLSVYISIYYLAINEDKSLKKIFFEMFEKFGNEKYFEFKSILQNNNLVESFNLLSLFGFGEIRIILLKKNELKFEIFEDIFAKISKNLFPNQYNIENNDLKIGFINGIFKGLFEINKTKIITKKKLNKLIITITKL